MELQSWINHFTRNGTDRPEPNWEAPRHPFTESQHRALLHSLTQFQLGDGGGPAYLIGHDRESYFGKHPQMRTLVDLWFVEEKRHSELLGKAVQRMGGTPITKHWSFSIFCGVRRAFGVSFEFYALLLTEITSNNYYKLLRKYAGDPAIVAMAELIIRDETGHIAFHRDRIATDEDGHYSLSFAWAAMLYLLALGAGTMLWINHRSALTRLGATTREFYRGFLQETRWFIETTRERRGESLKARRGIREDQPRHRQSQKRRAMPTPESHSANIGSSAFPCERR